METWFLADKPEAVEEKYQNVGQEKAVANERYVTQPPFRAKCLGWKGKNLFWYVFWRLATLGNKVSLLLEEKQIDHF